LKSRKTGPRPRAGSAKDAILDAAERLFALKGLATVSLRNVAAAAGVDAASITYHFGDKADLLQAVIVRRYEMLFEPRMAALMDLLERTGNKPTVRELFDSLFRPWLERNLHGEIGWKYYSKLLMSINFAPKIPYALDQSPGFLGKAFINALRLACPTAQDENILWGLCFTVGTSYFLFSETPRIDAMSNGRFQASDVERGYEFFLTYATAGFEAVVKEWNEQAAR
jgi:AcrR family transcriptional regulator